MGRFIIKNIGNCLLLYAGTATLIYLIKFNQNYYTQYKTAYIKTYNNDPNNPPDPKLTYGYFNTYDGRQYLLDQLPSFITYYRRNRDYSILGLAALYVANIIDATVDAYLFDYSVNQDLSLHIAPTINPFRAQIIWRLHAL